MSRGICWSPSDDDQHSRDSPPSVNCCFSRRKINLPSSVEISPLLLIFFPFFPTTTHIQELALHIKGLFPVFPPITWVGWPPFFPLPWSPEAAWGEEKHRKKTFGWAAGRASTPCADQEFVGLNCTLCDLLNMLRAAVKNALWDLDHQHFTLQWGFGVKYSVCLEHALQHTWSLSFAASASALGKMNTHTHLWKWHLIPTLVKTCGRLSSGCC